MTVVKEGLPPDVEDNRLLSAVCFITVLPGNPTKLLLESDDWDTVSPCSFFTTIFIYIYIFFVLLGMRGLCL